MEKKGSLNPSSSLFKLTYPTIPALNNNSSDS